MKLLVISLFPILMFLAWAVGGEYRFGKGKRGLLLAIPLTLLGLFYINLLGLALQLGLLYAIYCCLFYDSGIKMVYDKKDPMGWLIIGLNGAMIGLTCCMFGLARNNITTIVIGMLAGILGFIQVVKLSNDPKFMDYRMWLNKNGIQLLPYTSDKGVKGYYINMKDAWYVSEGLMGFVLAITLLVCLW